MAFPLQAAGMDRTSLSTASAPADHHSPEHYAIVTGDLRRDRDVVIGLWRGQIGWQNQLERMYDTFYLHCPFGQPRLQLLRHRPSGRIVGTIGAGPRPMRWRGREVVAACAAHLVVAPGHRSLAPAVRLVRALVEDAGNHFAFTYGLTNAHGDAVSRRAGFLAPGRLLRHVKVLRHVGYARRIIPGPAGTAAGGMFDAVMGASRALGSWLPQPRLHAHWIDAPEPRMQALWEAGAPDDALCTVRSTHLLTWRLMQLPARERRFLLVTEPGNGRLLAWFACETCVRDRHMLTVTDAWLGTAPPALAQPAVRTLVTRARQAGYHAIQARLAEHHATCAIWRAEGFSPRGKAQPFHFHGQPVPTAGELQLTDIEQDG